MYIELFNLCFKKRDIHASCITFVVGKAKKIDTIYSLLKESRLFDSAIPILLLKFYTEEINFI